MSSSRHASLFLESRADDRHARPVSARTTEWVSRAATAAASPTSALCRQPYRAPELRATAPWTRLMISLA